VNKDEYIFLNNKYGTVQQILNRPLTTVERGDISFDLTRPKVRGQIHDFTRPISKENHLQPELSLIKNTSTEPYKKICTVEKI